MADVIEKLLMLIMVYGVITVMAGKGAAGDLVRIACALGMLVFVTGKITYTFDKNAWIPNDIKIVEKSVAQGKEMFNIGFNEEIEKYIEEDIQEICRRYGAEGEVEVDISIEGGKAEVEKIELFGNFESVQGIGFIKNEIMNTYQVDEVKIVENKY